MTTLEFTKAFTQGMMSGLQVKEKMSFVDIAHACHWVEGINQKNKAGKVDYKVITFKATLEK